MRRPSSRCSCSWGVCRNISTDNCAHCGSFSLPDVVTDIATNSIADFPIHCLAHCCSHHKGSECLSDSPAHYISHSKSDCSCNNKTPKPHSHRCSYSCPIASPDGVAFADGTSNKNHSVASADGTADKNHSIACTDSTADKNQIGRCTDGTSNQNYSVACADKIANNPALGTPDISRHSSSDSNSYRRAYYIYYSISHRGRRFYGISARPF